MVPDPAAVAEGHDRADQPMAPAAQPAQLGAGGTPRSHGLLEPLAVDLQELVGAEHDRLGRSRWRRRGAALSSARATAASSAGTPSARSASRRLDLVDRGSGWR